MRTFQLDNVVKKTDNEVKAKKYLALGFKEIGTEEGDFESENVEELSRDEVKAQLDEAGIEYAKNAKTETLLEILEASKLEE